MKSKFLGKNQLILFLIVLLTITKVTLVGKGFLAFPDELRYMESGQMLKSLAKFDISSCIEHLFSTEGRPGDTLLKTIPVALQCATAYIFGSEIYESSNSFPLFIYNFIISCLILVVHYKVSLLFLKDKFFSLFSLFIFASLVASYISLRHSDPYDESLLILYYVLYKILKNTKPHYNYLNLLGYGCLAFFGYLCYPGYILLFFTIPAVLLFNQLTIQNKITAIKQVFVFGLGGIFCILLFELTARIAGLSYIKQCLTLSGTVNQGSFEECFSFLFKYLYEVEGFNGVFLIAGLILFGIVLITDLKKTKNSLFSSIYILFSVLLFFFTTYAIMGYYFHKVVFMARIIKQFLPFIIIFSVFAIQRLTTYFRLNSTAFNGLIFSACLILSIQFYITITEYKSYYYTKDISWQFYNQYRFKTAAEVFEYNKSTSDMPNFGICKKKKPLPFSKKIIFVNASGFYPFNDIQNYAPYKSPKGYRLVFAGLNSLAFKAYQFEGYDIQARKNLDKAKLKIKVYVQE